MGTFRTRGRRIVVEYIRYGIDAERAQAFEEACRRAAEALESSPHCERYEVSRSSEVPFVHDIQEIRPCEVTLSG